MSLTIAFVMDPMERVLPRIDTSFALMLAARERGHRVLHVVPNGLELEGRELFLKGDELSVFDRDTGFFQAERPLRLPASDVGALFIRKDPPFDQEYLTTTWLLSFASRRGVCVINHPTGLRSANEKLYGLEIAQTFPNTIVSADIDRIRSFVTDSGGEAIAKPLDGHGGVGVVRLRAGDSNVTALAEMLTNEGRTPVMVQAYLPTAERADRRLFLLNGDVRAVLTRTLPSGDHRSNVHVGGQVALDEVTDEDRAAAGYMRDRLRKDGMVFVGVDLLGGAVVDVNVTSPTLVRELRRLGGPDLAAEMIAWAEAHSHNAPTKASEKAASD